MSTTRLGVVEDGHRHPGVVRDPIAQRSVASASLTSTISSTRAVLTGSMRSGPV
ncbi:MAG: hypothetical protein ACFCVK_13670 [Acidimicrobiales bacterium]